MKKALGVILYSIGAIELIVSQLGFLASILLWIFTIAGVLETASAGILIFKFLGTFVLSIIIATIGHMLTQE